MPRLRRINFGFLSRFEEQLAWKTVKKLPSWMTPDMLTYSSFIFFCLSGLVYYWAGENLNLLWLAGGLIIGRWFTDLIDGKLAKHRGHSRPNYGYYLDHFLDATGVCLVFWGLYFSDLTSTYWPLVSFSLILLLMVSTYLIHSVSKTLYLSFGPIGGTEANFLLVLASIIGWLIKNRSFSLLRLRLSFFDWLFFLLVPILIFVLASSFAKNIRELRKEKPRESKPLQVPAPGEIR